MLGWNGGTATIQNNITQGAQAIVNGLRASDPSVKITWLDYYNIADTGNNIQNLYKDIPSTCASAIDMSPSAYTGHVVSYETNA